jgi:hypothetical protein
VSYEIRRTRHFTDHYLRDHLMAKPYVVNAGAGGSGTNQVKEGADKPAKSIDEGSVDEQFTFDDLNIKFMDLRNDIVVFDEKNGEVTAQASGSKPLGGQTIAGYDMTIGGGFVIKAVNIWPVVGLETTFKTQNTFTEKLKAEISKTFKTVTTDNAVLYPIGVTDGALILISSFSYFEWWAAWGQFDVVNTKYPFSIADQTYTKRYFYLEDEAKAPDLYDHGKLTIGQDRGIDDAMCAAFSRVWNTNSKTTEPVPVNLFSTYFPFGSWAVDRDGNQFISQLTSQGPFSYLSKQDDIKKLIELGDVFYPIAPV